MAKANAETQFPYPIPSRYQCVKLLGEGGSGLVYKAYDERLKRDVAIKFARSPSIISRHRLVNEARLLSSVDHPALCRVFDIGEPDVSSSSLFMVLEYIQGQPISQHLGTISNCDAIQIMLSLTNGVCQMHDADYAHNDITQHNVLLRQTRASDTVSMQAVLVDLSIAAPRAPKTVQHDINQLGALLLLLLTNKTPDQFFSLTDRKQNGLPAELIVIIKNAVGLDTANGYLSCQEFEQALSDALLRYHRKRSFIKQVALHASVIGLVILGFWIAQNSNQQGLLNEGLANTNPHAHAVVFANYSQHLANEGYPEKAAVQARLALNHFNDIIINTPGDLDLQAERLQFMTQSRGIFTPKELTTLLLNALNQLGKPQHYNGVSTAYYLQAKIYFTLAQLNHQQSHLVQRWGGLAEDAVSAAITHQPDNDRYQALHDKINAYQSNSGTG